MAITCTVAGVAQSFKMRSLRITEAMNAQNAATLSIVSANGSYRPALDAEVLLALDGTRIFGGVVTRPSEKGLGGLGVVPIETSLALEDFTGVAKRRIVTETIPAGTLKAALEVLVPYLSGYGVTLDPAQVAGPALPELAYQYRNLSEALDEVATLAGGSGSGPWVWEIDYYKVLRMFQPGSVSAPFNLSEGPTTVAIGDVTVETSRQQTTYANHIIAICGGTGQELKAQDFVTSGVAAPGGIRQYEADYPAPNDINGIWPNVLYFDGVAIQPISWHNDQLPPPTNAWWWDWETHSLYCDETVFGVPAAGQVIHIVYNCQFPFTVEANNLAEQAAKGIWDAVIELPDAKTIETGEALAAGYLTQLETPPKVVRYLTRTPGLHPGHTQTINLPTRGVNNAFLVTEVSLENDAGNQIVYRVSAVEGSVFPGSWRDTYKQWSSKGTTAAITSGAAAGGGSVAPGGGMATAYFLGGMGYDAVPTRGSGYWDPASAIQVFIDPEVRGSLTGSVRVRLRAASAGVSVVARLHNVSDDTTAGTSATVTSTTFQMVVFGVTFASGSKLYQLDVSSSVAGEDVFAVGYVE